MAGFCGPVLGRPSKLQQGDRQKNSVTALTLKTAPANVAVCCNVPGVGLRIFLIWIVKHAE